jgi:hypothetical protein
MVLREVCDDECVVAAFRVDSSTAALLPLSPTLRRFMCPQIP